MTEDEEELLPPNQEPNYKRAPQSHRESLNKIGEILYFKHRCHEGQETVEGIEELGGLPFGFKIVWGWSPGWSRGPSVKTFDTIIIKRRDENPDERWGAYWIRGKGTRVYGNYENFEKDVPLLKLIWI